MDAREAASSNNHGRAWNRALEYRLNRGLVVCGQGRRWSFAMPQYKFMVLDHRDHLIEVLEVPFSSDVLASERAKAIYIERSAHAVEVWQSARFICRMNQVGLEFAAA
jgi:hypothetical protein